MQYSVWIPCQRLDWLGITWDNARGTIEIADRKVAKITSTIDSRLRFCSFCQKIGLFYRAYNFYSACFREHF